MASADVVEKMTAHGPSILRMPNNLELQASTILCRRIKTGLISVDIVSHWCWSSTILQSANQAWIYGVTGPYWYAGGEQQRNLRFFPTVLSKFR